MIDFKPSLLDRAVCAVSPTAGMKRLAAKRVLHQFRYDGAESSSKRASAPHNMSPNSFDVQRDRLQLMREAEDMERNFAPAMMLNRKVAMYSSPISYHSMTGDHELSREVEEYLNTVAFKECDITRRYDFFKMLEFGLMGMNRGGDYGWAFMREGLEDGMSEDDALHLPLRIQAVEPDRIGGIYQNVVSNDYVSGCVIGKYGEITHFRVFHRSMTTNVYDNPVDIPANDFVHMTDPMRIDMYRGVSTLATAVQNLRDLYESIDFVKGKMKLASALTVFTNSNGGMAGGGAFDAYQTNIPNAGNALQQDIQFGQINHLAGGTDIKFPASNSPSSEEQALMTLLMKFVAMSYRLPYSFALDAAALGGVSSRLESEMAKAEFGRMQKVIEPHADRMKNMLLLDATAKGIFSYKDYQKITKGRWGYRQHPQPDLGKEANAAVNLYQTGLLDPMGYWVENAQDPEDVAANMVRWHKIKTDAAEAAGFEITDVFGSGPAKPVSVSESTTESTSTDATSKQFSRKNFKESYDSIIDRIKETEGELAELEQRKAKFVADSISDSPSLAQRARIAIDRVNQEIRDVQNDLSELRERKWRRDSKRAAEPTEQDIQKREQKRDERWKRRAIFRQARSEGYPENEAWAMAYDITKSGKFDQSKITQDTIDEIENEQSDERNHQTTPEERIRRRENRPKRHSSNDESAKHFKSNVPFDESKHPRGPDGEFGPGGSHASSSPGRSQRASIGNLMPASREGTGKESRLVVNGKPAPDFIKPGMIPPAYSHNIRLATDRNSDVWAISEDEKGNTKRVYNPEFEKRNAAIKWARTNEGVGKIDSIRSQIHNDRNQGKNKEEADAAWLMSQQATRPGSEEDTKGTKALWSRSVTAKDFTLTPQPKGPPKVSIKVGDSNIPIRDEGARAEITSRIEHGSPMGDAGYWLKSHGATTLEGRHVVKNPDGSASLQFMGKEGVWHDHKVTDPKLSEMLLGRKDAAGDTGKLFKTDYANVAKYVGTLGGGGFSPKDMRTIRANEIATKLIGSKPIEVSSDNERKAIIKDIATTVSRTLGNRPQQALESYINPMIFDAIKVKQSA